MSTNKNTPTENDNILKNGNTLNINNIQKYKHMKVIKLIACILFSVQLIAQGQTQVIWDTVFTVPKSKNGTCNTSSSGDYLYYNDLNTWIPRGGSLPLQNSPNKVIQLNFNVFQRTNGTGKKTVW